MQGFRSGCEWLHERLELAAIASNGLPCYRGFLTKSLNPIYECSKTGAPTVPFQDRQDQEQQTSP